LASTSLGRRLWSNAAETYQIQEEIVAQALGQAKKVVITYHSFDHQQRPIIASTLIESLKSLWPDNSIPFVRTNWPLPPEPSKICDSGEMWLYLAKHHHGDQPPKEFLELSGFGASADALWRSMALRRSRTGLVQTKLLEHQLQAWLKLYMRDAAVPEVNLNLLTQYAQCPRSFWFHRILGLSAGSEPIEEWPSTDRGSVIHTTLERFLAPLRDKTKKDLSNGRLKYIFWEVAHKNSCHTPIGRKPIWEAKTHQLEKHMFNWLERQREELSQVNIEALEWSFSYPLETKFGPLKINGRIDRIDRKNGQLVIKDYKATHTTFFENKKSDSENDRPAFHYPLILYGLAAEKAFKSEVKIFIEFIDPNDKEPEIEIPKGDAELFSTIWENLNLGSLGKTTDDQTCYYCEYSRICHRGLDAPEL
jgi:RecB family exonuclease